MLKEDREEFNGEYDPLLDFNKHYNPSVKDREAAEKLMREYEKRASERKIKQ